MAETSRLDIILGARDRVSRVLSRLRRRLGMFARRLAQISTAAATAAAVGLTALFNKQSDIIDQTAKVSARLDIATERLVGLQFAAEQTGASADSVSAALDVLQKRLGEFAQSGTGAAQKGMEILNLEIENLRELSPVEQFELIADRVSRLENVSDKAAATASLFSRANQDLVNTLNQGSDGLQRMQRRAEEVGATFSRVEAAQVEAANDALGEMSLALGGIARQLTIRLAPLVEFAAEKFTELATSGVLTGRRVSGAIEAAAVRVGALIDVIQELRIAVGVSVSFIGRQMANIAEGAVQIQKTMADIVAMIPTIDAGLSPLGQTTLEWAENMRAGADELDRFVEGLRNQESIAERVADAIERIKREAREAAEEAVAGAGGRGGGLQSPEVSTGLDSTSFAAAGARGGNAPVTSRFLEREPGFRLDSQRQQLNVAREQKSLLQDVSRKLEPLRDIRDQMDSTGSNIRFGGI